MYIIRWGEMVVTASAAGELSVEIRHTNPGIHGNLTPRLT
jgi:hypothetical protein